ncbi:DNA cytosine methyltransferase [Diaphorobacter caeni]|uniref:DNA cytosine methyltransferase n=1 Tax=Diaphorobacter caeni TaxID=2784387 RepID=UPI00188E9242|nr:DNA cytosine methyltransferase [Diaphorobacter caeni]MBF5006889.1 DNA cytosine methyltransferase [Diaphorobacter caeni]
MIAQEITHFHLFGGAGSGAAGFNDATPDIGTIKGRMRCVGGIDVDARACADFKTMTGVPQACVDLFDIEQYKAWHGHMPPPGWVEASADTVRQAAHGYMPDIVFLSAPCKGFSGLLAAAHASTVKYQALNQLTLRGVWLMLEAFADNPPGLIIFENVPRIATRGRHLLDQIISMLQHYGYATAETTHDCGELGDGLAQSRRRFLLVARHAKKVPPFLYEPPRRALRSVGEVLGHMPLPGDPLGGPMHRMPALQWKTWVRLAFVEAGSDWRSLGRLAVENGHLRDYLVVPEMHGGMLGVNRWNEHTGTVTSRGLPTNGNFAIADPRFEQSAKWKDGQALGVRRWEESTGTVAGQQGPLQGAYSVADPRHDGPAKHSNEFRIVQWDRAARAVTSAHGTGQAIADPRQAGEAFAKYAVTAYDQAAGTVIAGSTTGQGAFAVADPRPGMQRTKGDAFHGGGHYGVVRYAESSGAVSASACHDNGPWCVADPRVPDGVPAESLTGAVSAAVGTQLERSVVKNVPAMPAPNDKLVARIQSLDGTWHRPFTTLELAALQSFIDPEEYFAATGPAARGEQFVLDGGSDQRWREAIGNAVPRKAAKAIGTVMGQTILLARNGETFVLGSTPIWVQPMVAAISVAQGAQQ